MRTCEHCGGTIQSNNPDSRFCHRPDCRKAYYRDAQARFRKPPKQRACRHCGTDITGQRGQWCKAPECQEDRWQSYRTHNHQQEYLHGRGRRGKSKVKKIPTGRKCSMCGKEIYRLVDPSGIVIFDWRFCCYDCRDLRKSLEGTHDLRFCGVEV